MKDHIGLRALILLTISSVISIALFSLVRPFISKGQVIISGDGEGVPNKIVSPGTGTRQGCFANESTLDYCRDTTLGDGSLDRMCSYCSGKIVTNETIFTPSPTPTAVITPTPNAEGQVCRQVCQQVCE